MALCRDNELTVLNGRTKGEPNGAITFERVANRATLDYAIASWDCQADMKVIQEAWAYSDHAALDVALTLAAPTIVSQDHTVLVLAVSCLLYSQKRVFIILERQSTQTCNNLVRV